MNKQKDVVLVTGAAGFTGRYMIAKLEAEGFTVRPVVRTAQSGSLAYACDLTDAAQVKQMMEAICPDYLVHLAAQSFVGHSGGRDFYDANIFGTLNLFDAVTQLRLPIKKALVASSANIYGRATREEIDEKVCPAPINHYANSKLAMEHMVRNCFDKVPTIIVRPFNYTGVGQDERFVIPKIVGHFKRREERISLGNINVSRDFSDVRDVVSAYCNLLISDCHSEVLNICSGTAYSISDVLSFLEQEAGYKICVDVNAGLVRSNEIPRLVGVNSKLSQWIEYRPEFEFHRTIIDMYNSC